MLGKRVDALKSVFVFVCVCVCVCVFGQGAVTPYKLFEYDLAPQLEIYYDFNRDDSCWCPRASVVFNVLLSARITSAFVSNISDCDEAFNYWEPVST